MKTSQRTRMYPSRPLLDSDESLPLDENPIDDTYCFRNRIVRIWYVHLYFRGELDFLLRHHIYSGTFIVQLLKLRQKF